MKIVYFQLVATLFLIGIIQYQKMLYNRAKKLTKKCRFYEADKGLPFYLTVKRPSVCKQRMILVVHNADKKVCSGRGKNKISRRFRASVRTRT